jgi:hypothetical protein
MGKSDISWPDGEGQNWRDSRYIVGKADSEEVFKKLWIFG